MWNLFSPSYTEWADYFGLITLVLTAELINTAIEEVCDVLRDRLGVKFEETEKARDIAAGAVLGMQHWGGYNRAYNFLPKIFHLI